MNPNDKPIIIVPAAPRTWVYRWDGTDLWLDAVVAWAIYEDVGQDEPVRPIIISGEVYNARVLFDCSEDVARERAEVERLVRQ